MRLILEPSTMRSRVTPSAALDYSILAQQFRTGASERELLLVGRVMGEYLLFLERVRKLLEAARRQNGLRDER